ncbi:MAG: hypothetical protein PWQ55_653 [Chloroflexota bacterium]|nr:hypothetical protein [Chloroflexota bacterium]
MKNNLRFGLILLSFAILLSFFVLPAGMIYASNSKNPELLKTCGCLEYVQKKKGLPGTNHAAGADRYASWLKKNGYKITSYTPDTKNPSKLVGTMMVWKRGVKGSNSKIGHIAIVQAASYNSKNKTWTIKFINAAWSEGTKTKDSYCNNVTVVTKNYKDLVGLSFFTAKKK